MIVIVFQLSKQVTGVLRSFDWSNQYDQELIAFGKVATLVINIVGSFIKASPNLRT